MGKTGHADLPLHYGNVPYWLSQRMKELGTLIVESLVYNFGKKEDVFGEIECCVTRNVNMICSFFSFEGSLTLRDVSNLYEIYKKKNGPEYILFNSDSEEYKVLSLWQKTKGEE